MIFIKVLSILSICFVSLDAKAYKPPSAQEIYDFTMDSLKKENWQYLLHFSKTLNSKFNDSSFSKDSIYYQAIAYFNLKD